AESRPSRLAAFALAARERRVWRSGPKIRVHRSAGLYRRMHERPLFLVKEGMRHAAEARPRGYCASQTDASTVEARPEQFAKAGETLRAARDSVRPLD